MDKTEVKELIQNEVNSVNQKLASYESIKDILIAKVPFSIETGELTPSLKIKRRVVLEKFKEELDKLYQRNEVK